MQKLLIVFLFSVICLLLIPRRATAVNPSLGFLGIQCAPRGTKFDIPVSQDHIYITCQGNVLKYQPVGSSNLYVIPVSTETDPSKVK